MQTCPQCSHQTTEDNALHCSNCGAPLKPHADQEPADAGKRTMFGYAVTHPAGASQPTGQPAPSAPSAHSGPRADAAAVAHSDPMAGTGARGEPRAAAAAVAHSDPAAGSPPVAQPGPHRPLARPGRPAEDRLVTPDDDPFGKTRIDTILPFAMHEVEQQHQDELPWEPAASSSPQPRPAPSSTPQPSPSSTQQPRPYQGKLAAPASLPSNAPVSFKTQQGSPPRAPDAQSSSRVPVGEQAPAVTLDGSALSETMLAASPAQVAPGEAGKSSEAAPETSKPVAPRQQAQPGTAQDRGSAAAQDPGPTLEPEIPHTVLDSSTVKPEQEATKAARPARSGEPASVPQTRIHEGARPESEPVVLSEPGRTLIRVLMVLGGLLLLGMFFSPWGSGSGDELVFSWDLLSTAGGLAAVSQIYLAAGGVFLLAVGLIPMPYLLRALLAMVLGLIPLVLRMVALAEWRDILILALLALLPAALFHRGRFTGSILARILVGLGVAGVLAAYLVPKDSGIPLVQALTDLGEAEPTEALTQLFPLLLPFFAVLSLLAFLGRRSSGLSCIWALGILFFLPVLTWLSAALHLLDEQELWSQIPQIFGGLALLIFLVVTAVGLGQVFARAEGGGKVPSSSS